MMTEDPQYPYRQPLPMVQGELVAVDSNGDYPTSWIRTVVPILWGAVLTFLLTRFPAVHDFVDNPAIAAAFETIVTGLYYTIIRWLEQHLPPWLTRLFIGANATPVYPPKLPPAP